MKRIRAIQCGKNEKPKRQTESQYFQNQKQKKTKKINLSKNNQFYVKFSSYVEKW